MTTIICPNCKSHISEWDLNCLNCGMTITEELREKLVGEMERKQASESAEEDSFRENVLKRHRKFQLQRKLNRLSLRLFKTGFSEIVVPFFIVILILVVIALVLLRDFGFLI